MMEEETIIAIEEPAVGKKTVIAIEIVETTKFTVAEKTVIAIEIAETAKFAVAKSELVTTAESVSAKETRPHSWVAPHTASRCSGDR
jgi:hypothetical protein